MWGSRGCSRGSNMEESFEATALKIITDEVDSCYTYVEVSSSKKRRQSKKQEESTVKPKKPRSAYLLYYFDIHQSMQRDNPDLPQSEVNKRISESWKSLTVAERAFYLEKAKLEREGVDPKKQLAGTSTDIPGFRKILPRADYVILAKDEKAGSLEVRVDGVEQPVEGLQETLFPPMVVGNEVELAEPCVAMDGLTEFKAAAIKRSGTLQEILGPLADSVGGGGAFSSLGMVMEEQGAENSAVQQVKEDGLHLVTIIPNQGVVESNASGTSSVFLVSMGSSQQSDPKTSVKLSIKYTRRGRGRCHTPGCSYTYITRHKPAYCPTCGQQLGGKWVPRAEKTKTPGQVKKRLPRKPLSNQGIGGQAGVIRPDPPLTQLGSTAVVHNEELEGALSETQPTEGATYMEQLAAAKPCPTKTPVSHLKGKSQECVRISPKRPVRAILPAPVYTALPSRPTLIHCVTVPPVKASKVAVLKMSAKAAKPFPQPVTRLKASTLKQLGSIKVNQQFQDPPSTNDQHQNDVPEQGLKILSVVSKANTFSTLDLGHSTARGRGRCKNPSCDYVYKNRHKPSVCPRCGYKLRELLNQKPQVLSGPDGTTVTLLDPFLPLSAAQKETQRQSTLLLLRRCTQIPETEVELQEILSLIQELNIATAAQKRGEAQGVRGWPSYYEPPAEECVLCNFPLYKGGKNSAARRHRSWLLTESRIQTVTLQHKICLNPQCLALHSFCDLHPGLFNVGNQLLVSLDTFFKIRNQIKAGLDPNEAVLMILNTIQDQKEHTLTSRNMGQVQELLCSGYWAFECLTLRDYNDMICGVCGIAPKMEIARRNTDTVLRLKKVEFTWPDFMAADEVNVDDFWLTMENEAIEQAAFPSSIPITKFDASIIAPFIPPLMRSSVVINTEKDKIVFDHPPAGDQSVLVRLIQDGLLKLETVQEHSEEELREILHRCGISCESNFTKGQMIGLVCGLYACVQNGQACAPQPPSHITAGKLYKVCPHQVVCGSKYMVRGENARDHVDLLVSSRYWPPVYVTDSARQVSLCTDILYPELASHMWGKNQGCFSDPMEKPEYVSCAELQDQQYSLYLSGVENTQVHPITKSCSRWIVNHEQPCETLPTPRHHSMSLCRELEPYRCLVATLDEPSAGDAGALVRQKPMMFDNPAYYYLYNRLIDFLTSKDIINQQITDVVQGCQPGEVVIRDSLYRLGVAQINTEAELEVESEEVAIAECSP